MTIQLRQAERLCSDAEFTLVKAALAPALRELDEKRLAAHITRARRARDKHRDLLRRQRLTSRERTGQKAGRSGDANARTREKAELFQEVLERFEARAADVGRRDGQESRGMTGKRTAKKKTAQKKASTKGAATKEASTKKSAKKKTVEKAVTAKADKAKADTKKAATKKAATKKAATKKAATKKAATKKAATKNVGTKKAAAKEASTKKGAKRRPAVGPDESGVENSRPSAGNDGGPVVQTPTERVAEKVREGRQRPDDLERSGVARQAIDPGVTNTHGARFVSDRAKVASQQAGSHGAREEAIQGHVGSRGRRNQAKRDNKN